MIELNLKRHLIIHMVRSVDLAVKVFSEVLHHTLLKRRRGLLEHQVPTIIPLRTSQQALAFFTGKEPDPRWGSIETLHDNLYRWCGGSTCEEGAFGQMSWAPVAALDPIF